MVHPEVKNWIKYAKFEQKHNYVNSARRIYERAVEFFGEDNISEQILIEFAKFEESQKEVCHLVMYSVSKELCTHCRFALFCY